MYDSKIDILFINETKLDSTVHDSDVYIPGFEIENTAEQMEGKGAVFVSTCVQILTIEYVLI